ncbi:hypothetical protein Tco_1023524 [Tanacetum coccineum]
MILLWMPCRGWDCMLAGASLACTLAMAADAFQGFENGKSESGLVKTRRAARRVWTQVEVYRKWLQIDLQKKARDAKTSKEILEWLRDEAVKIVIHFKSCKKRRMDDSHYKFIVASSMYRVSETILIHCSELETWPIDGQLLEWISNMIADILCACFTNLPCVICWTFVMSRSQTKERKPAKVTALGHTTRNPLGLQLHTVIRL